MTTLENNDQVSSVKVKNIVQEEVAELKEIESRRLNMICLNLPESKKIDLSERKQEDNELLVNLLQNRMEVDTDEITIDKLVRLGRSDSKNGAIKCRPLRFTVNSFEHKRQILKASSLLRNSPTDDVFSNVYFTPDLTKNQRKVAYKLRVERRSREENGEDNLKISRGKIVVVKKNKDVNGSLSEGIALSSSPSVSA